MQIEKTKTKLNCKHNRVLYFRRRTENMLFEFWRCLDCHKIVEKRISGIEI